MQPAKSRPTGVTIIAILNIIGGTLGLMVGTALVAVGGLIPGVLYADTSPSMSGMPGEVAGVLGTTIGAVVIALAALGFIAAYGMLKGMGWAWTLAVV